MKRTKRHKIKREMPETSTALARDKEEHDLAYYIHDRVELMHQVFSCLKYRELKAMAPECVRHISVDDLQELCTEELLGISSKRLCAILDGGEPPSDTESSSASLTPENLETISLDSISSDEEILSQSSSKKTKKHKHRRTSKSKSKRKKSKDQADGDAEQSRASRAGLTVLELLELQARARAIRAQLQQEQQHKPQSGSAAPESSHHSSDGEVEIKEEPAEVVEISSDEEKPKIQELEKEKPTNQEKQTPQETTTVTKRINDLIITVPQTKPSRKIKLNRNKVTVSVPSTEKITSVATPQITPESGKNEGEKTVKKIKKKKKGKKKNIDKDASDHDEITLQLSDSEKMDLLEDLDRKSCGNVTSMDSESSSEDSDASEKDVKNSKEVLDKKALPVSNSKKAVESNENTEKISEESNMNDNKAVSVNEKEKEDISKGNTEEVNTDEVVNKTFENNAIDTSNNDIISKEKEIENTNEINKNTDEMINIDHAVDITVVTNKEDLTQTDEKSENNQDATVKDNEIEKKPGTNDCLSKKIDTTKIDEIPIREEVNTEKEAVTDQKVAQDTDSKQIEKELSEGELSDKGSSEVEAVDLKSEVVCISDEEIQKTQKKKKKNEKKSKKDKKSKKKDFRESADQNFYKKCIANSNTNDNKNINKDIKITITIDNTNNASKQPDSDTDDVYEILEISDDSSCYEVEGTVLSKEPTAEEIEALSAKIDEIERVEVITEQEIHQYERDLTKIENISWKDRYLDSNKVKKVLTTSNILNALRKKNKELKKKIEDSKKEGENIRESTEEVEEKVEDGVLEGTIEHYNTLQGSTKYVDPVAEVTEDKEVTREMKKDAKQLLKMYKRLLKYNDMNKQKEPKKKKKKKKTDSSAKNGDKS